MKKKAHTGEHRTIAANLHLKRNTKGTSNELSLSVLGGLSAQKDEEDVSLGGSGASPSFTMPHVFFREVETCTERFLEKAAHYGR